MAKATPLAFEVNMELSLSSSKDAPLFGWSRGIFPTQRPYSRNLRFVLAWMSTPSTVSNQLTLHSPLHNDLSWIPGRELRGDDKQVFSFRPRYVGIGWIYVRLTKRSGYTMRAFADTSVETAPFDGIALRDLQDSWDE